MLMPEDPTDRWVETGWLVRRDDGERRLPFQMRFLAERELEQVFHLHRHIVDHLPSARLFRADSRDFMAMHIRLRGRTVGVFCEDELVAYAVISFPHESDGDNLGRDLPLPESELRHVADYDGSAVHPAFRGNALQRKMTDMRHRWALLHERFHILGTVSPENPVSLHNFLTLGSRIKNLKSKYGGLLRYIIHHDLRETEPLPFEPVSVIEVPMADIELQRLLLAKGHWGYRVVFQPRAPRLCYGLPLQVQAAVA
jgi:hypothetical protein